MTITRKEISDAVQNELGYSKTQSIEMIEHLIELIISSLENDEDVLISGFGKFCVKDKDARKGRNPATEEAMILPARKVVTFKCSGKLRKRVNHID